jgi:hypothetical protein
MFAGAGAARAPPEAGSLRVKPLRKLLPQRVAFAIGAAPSAGGRRRARSLWRATA